MTRRIVRMKPRRQKRGRWLHRAMIAYGAFAGLSVAILSFLVISPPVAPARATVADNVMGWAWADPIGWISLNDLNPGSGGGSYGVGVDLVAGDLSGFGWSPNVGWVCFGASCGVPECSGAVPPSTPAYDGMIAQIVDAPQNVGSTMRAVHGWAKVCSLGEAGWLSLNCDDPNPSVCGAYNYHVAFDMSTFAFSDATPPGSPDNGSSFGWNGNDDDTGIGYVDFSRAYLVPPTESDDLACDDTVDNDLDGAIDCVDPGCANATPCLPPPPDLTEAEVINCGTVDECCSDGIDNEGDGLADCADLSCQGVASMCTIDWLRTKFGNVYAQQGIDAVAPPANQFNATYCLSNSSGAITGFSSQIDCATTVGALSLPVALNGFRGSLGALDIFGMIAGRYGTVVPIGIGESLPEELDGNMYLYQQPGTLHLPARTFQNAIGAGRRGNGLLLVIGADVAIDGDLTYASTNIDTSLRNVASFGLIVIAENGVGGNILIDPAVSTVSGAYFAENEIHTGASATPLSAYGLMAARRFSFERNAGTNMTASEEVIFDGRALVNPPPGMQDVGKTLPRVKDAF